MEPAQRTGPIEVGVKRQVFTIGLVLSIAAVATGLWVFAHMGFFPPLVVALLFFTTGVLVFARLLITGPYVFRLDDQGFNDRSGALSAGRVAWDELAAVRVVTAEGRPQLGIVLTEEARAARGLLIQGAMSALRQQHGVDFVIPPEAIGPETAEAQAARFDRWRADPAARKGLAS